MTRFRLPRRRLRALFPLAVAALAAWLYPDEPLWTGLIVAIGAAGAASVARSDARSSLDRWQRRHPGLSFHGVAGFPAAPPDGEEGAFDAACEAVAQALQALAEHRPTDRPERRARRRTRRELEGVLALGARLAVQVEQLDRLPEAARTPGVAAERRRAQERLALLPAAARRLRDALLRAAPTAAAPDLAPLADLVRREGGLTARSEALAELGALEVGP